MTDQNNSRPPEGKLVINTATTPSVPSTQRLQPNGGITVSKGLRARIEAKQADISGDAMTRVNRIALMLDASGSMRGERNKALIDACVSFVQNCNFNDTALAMETFGAEPEISIPLTTQSPLLMMTAMSIPAHGGTPMSATMERTLRTHSMTRGIIVSDGEPDSRSAAYDAAREYAKAEIPVDCVHIGNSTSGEECLKTIAEITGGMFIKFTDITSFSKNFKFLTPAFYAQLTSGNVSAAQLGAREIE